MIRNSTDKSSSLDQWHEWLATATPADHARFWGQLIPISGKQPNASGWINGLRMNAHDKNASFGINLETGGFKDFGGRGEGDQIAFIMQRDNVGAPEAARIALSMVNAGGDGASGPPVIMQPDSPQKPVSDQDVESWAAALIDAKKGPAARALEYLVDRRGLRPETLAGARVGFMVDKGPWITFPVHRHDGGGYTVKLYKFNPSKMDWARKPDGKKIVRTDGGGSWLYMHDEAVLDDRPVLLVEGEIDALTARQSGYNAISGTAGAMTVLKGGGEIIARLPGIKEGVTICFDGDETGRTGAQRWGSALAAIVDRSRVFIANMPDGEDVNSLHAGGRVDELASIIAEAVPYAVDPGFSTGLARTTWDSEPAGEGIGAELDSIGDDMPAEEMYRRLAAAIAPMKNAGENEARARCKESLGDRIDLNTLTKYTVQARVKAKKARKLASIEDAGKPTIRISGRDPEAVVKDAVEALVSWNSPPVIFTRSEDAVVIRTDENGRPYVSAASPELLDNRMQEAASFVVETDKQIKPAQLPMRFIRQIPTIEPSPFPSLRGIIEAPFMRKDGTILDTSGYDPETSLYYAPPDGFNMPVVPMRPSREDVTEAVRVLEDIVTDFKYVSESDKANFYGLLLTPLMRPIIDSHVMMAGINAPSKGSGKTLKASILSVVATGRRVETMTMPETEEEWRKQITSQLMKGGPLIVVDNIKGRLSSGSLEQALTSDTWTDRLLGTNRNINLPQRAVWVATGNNLAPYGDMVRRVYMINLDPETAQPWMRDGFTHPNLMAHVERERGRIVWALLTMARAWHMAGQPEGKVKPGSFERWGGVIGGVLDNAGVNGFLGNLGGLYESADEEDSELYQVLTTLRARFTDNAFFAGDVDQVIQSGLKFSKAPERDRDGNPVTYDDDTFARLKSDADFAYSLLSILPGKMQDDARRGNSIKRSFGMFLSYKKGRFVSGEDGQYRIADAGTVARVTRWKVEHYPAKK